MEDVRIKDKTFTPYIGEADLQHRIKTLARELNEVYLDKHPLLVPVLNGAFLFTADLIREMNTGPEVHFIRVSSYGNEMTSSGNMKVPLGLETEIRGRHVIIVEDIVDSGYTCDYLMDYFQSFEPASVIIITLLYKPASHKGKYKPDYVCFEIPPEFVVGYGLDYAQHGRELRGIYRLKA
ncbi:MAG: hypoxanthine phosphoribosyltransferase [Bacteroidia bacterium]|nr:hypoxanthine phosphoribosyltransferase [Bacteroidia bacterium]